jgi:dTDP-4-dehydrorhamnose reductase
MKEFKIVILGASGQLGYTLLKYLIKKRIYCFCITSQSSILLNSKYIYKKCKFRPKKLKIIKNEVINFAPNYIINCLSLNKKNFKNKKLLQKTYINIPKIFSKICLKKKIGFINISTDIVFDGQRGNYLETDMINPQTEYAKYKLKSERIFKNFLNIRLSIIGLNPLKKNGFIDWIMNEKKVIKGYKNYIFSGITSLEISRVLLKIMLLKQRLIGIYHLSGPKISKYDLVNRICKVFSLRKRIIGVEMPVLNLSLNSRKIKRNCGIRIKNIHRQLIDLKNFNYE